MSNTSVELNKTFTHKLENIKFDNLPEAVIIEIYKDGRAFAKLIEPWLSENYPIIHITGDKPYDHIDNKDYKIRYDAKTFTKHGCGFASSCMIGAGRKFDSVQQKKNSQKLIYCLISNINFPEIKIKFIKGCDLIKIYPNAKIPYNDHDKIFN